MQAFVDDYAHISQYDPLGEQELTPALNTFCRNGARFEQGWTYPMCTPTRSTLLTGRSAHASGMGGAMQDNVSLFAQPDLRLFERHWTLPTLLKANDPNFRTALFGKWHLGVSTEGIEDCAPIAFGFDRYMGHVEGQNITIAYDEELHPAPEDGYTYYRWEFHDIDRGCTPSVEGAVNYTDREIYSTDGHLEDFEAWIADFVATDDGDDRFFVWFAPNAPPDPWTEPPRPSSSVYNPIWENETVAMVLDNLTDEDGDGDRDQTDCEGLRVNPNMACEQVLHLLMVAHLDSVIGRLEQTLEQAGMRDETLIIVLGDNGSDVRLAASVDEAYADGLSKNTVYEQGSRVPMCMRGAGIEPSTVVEDPVVAADLYATLLEMLLDQPVDALTAEAVAIYEAEDYVPGVTPQTIAFNGRSLVDRLFFGQPHRRAQVTELFNFGVPAGDLAPGAAIRWRFTEEDGLGTTMVGRTFKFIRTERIAPEEGYNETCFDMDDPVNNPMEDLSSDLLSTLRADDVEQAACDFLRERLLDDLLTECNNDNSMFPWTDWCNR
ncbi:MAG: sulfatase-like hydrolase/transferase, partial [Myxococcota bacterium]